MKVLHVTPSYFPATKWGGPIRSTKAICDGIHATPGMKVQVLTTDAASPDRHDRVIPAALPYPVHFARRVAGHSIAPGLLARLPAAITWADVVHLTATYSFPTLPTLAIARLLGRPVIWSPRGALQATAEWDDAPNARAKHLFEKAAQVIRPANTVLHVTSTVEAKGSVARLPGIATTVIPNCVDIPALPPKTLGDGLRLIYLGRLHPKKGIDLLLDAMERLPATTTLDIYGTGTPRYDAMLRSRAARFAGRVRLHGHVEGPAKSTAFAKADLFVLPSHSENFGIAVAEALAHAMPVITTTGTPWQALDHQGCGRCIDMVNADLAAEIIGLTNGDLIAMGRRGRAWMQRDFSAGAMNAAFADLYEGVTAPAGERVTV
ncbi:glycosyltransferase [Yoonia sp. 2307UL14-13]|uniref:glycosyltransferase n=1 Tax=Yoonia sp. 2307UL14-13 TaxID=3126506 RepID=UPI0030A7FE02